MLGGVKEHPERMAELLVPHAETIEEYPNWLRWITRFADVHKSRALFELVVESVRRGEYDGYDEALWMSVYDLGKHEPAWAAELLTAYLMDRPGALELDDSGRVAALTHHEHGATRIVSAAAGTPLSFCELLLPYMLKVMELTAFERKDRPASGRHFFHREFVDPSDGSHVRMYDLSEALLAAMFESLRAVLAREPVAAQQLLDRLGG